MGFQSRYQPLSIWPIFTAKELISCVDLPRFSFRYISKLLTEGIHFVWMILLHPFSITALDVVKSNPTAQTENACVLDFLCADRRRCRLKGTLLPLARCR